MTAGVHFERTEAYAPVPSWTNIKLQLALTAKHRFGLRAFDCTAAYLQAELKTPQVKNNSGIPPFNVCATFATAL
jgi:hypothetical protein